MNDLYDKTTIINLETFDPNIFSRDGGYSFTVYILPDGRCGVIDHVWSGNGVIYVAFIVVECGDSTGTDSNQTDGTESSPNNYYNPTDWNGIFNNYLNNNNYYAQYGNGGSTMGNGPESGYINLPDDSNDYFLDITISAPPPQIDENIAALSIMTNNTRLPYKQKIAVLNTRLNDATESGFEFRTTNTGGIAPAIAISGNANGISFPIPQINTKVRMHVHTNSLDPFFSEMDITGMSELFAVKDDHGATDAAEVTSLLVTPRGLYALRVDDPSKVIAFNDKMKTGLDEN